MSDSRKGFAIEITNVNKSFGSLEDPEEFNLSIEPGDFVAVIGHGGSGKSDLLRMIAGLDPLTGGSIKIDGKEVVGVNHQVSVMFQEPRLLPWMSVISNVMIGTADKNEAAAAQSLERAGVINQKAEWPGSLSDGQKQRVSLARALAGNPRILLLDEPLGALDAITRYEIQEVIEKIWTEQGFTGILATRDVSEAVKLANRVILLEDKKIVLDIKITLPRPRLKDNDANYFEQLIMNKLLKLDDVKKEIDDSMWDYSI